MEPLTILLVFVFGTLVGSFINVVSLRYNTGLSITSGRSKCFNCNITLKWYEMVPLFSFAFLKGRCRTCKNYISNQYPIVEFLTGIVFVLIVSRQINLWHIYGSFENGLLYSIIFLVFYIFIFSLLLIIAIYDLRHKIIPDKLSYTFIFLSSLKLLFFFYVCNKLNLSTPVLLDLLSPIILFLLFASLWYFSNGRWMGFGDAKLAFGIGAFLGFSYGLSAIILAFWIGAVWGVFIILKRKFDPKAKKVTMSSQIPFAPFLILALAVVFFWKLDVLGLQDLISLQ
ncbi:MAG: prepilin peptidase [Minisyncoccia bacterium]